MNSQVLKVTVYKNKRINKSYSGNLMQRANSLEKNLMLGKMEG